MKTLRLFISHNLEIPINWVIINDDVSILESGSSTFEELLLIKDVNVEVYLSTNCCSVFKLNVSGITNKRLTEELVLGMLEDQLVDDVDACRAVVLRNMDTVYAAVFNREYYDKLLDKLYTLHKTVLFIQSIAYATIYKDECLTIFLDKEQSFVRISQYEYCLLDDNLPLPILLEDLLLDRNPKKVYLYADNLNSIELLTAKLGGSCQVMRNDELIFGKVVWNFYNQKSSKFRLKLWSNTQSSLKNLWKTFKWFSLCLVGGWIFFVIFLSINNARNNMQIKHELQSIVPKSVDSKDLMYLAQSRIAQMYHMRGIYASNDAVPLIYMFLEVVSTVGTNSITQIKYNKGQLEVLLNDTFNPSQFASYKNIFLVKQMNAEILEYRAYAKIHKKEAKEGEDGIVSGSREGSAQLMPVGEENTKWVISLTPIISRK